MSETYFCGIDLGTSRTSIATSTGIRLTTDTVVGYAKDVIAQKRFGANYLLGKDAIDNRLALRMVWPLADGVLQISDENIKSTTLIIQNIIKTAIPDKKSDDKIFASIGLPAQASMTNKTDVLRLSKGLVDKLLIVSEPFAVAYGLDRFDEVLICDVGAGTVDLVRIKGTMPEDEDQVTLTTAGNYLDTEIEKAILVKYPKVQLTKQIIKRIKEKYGYVTASEKVLIKLTENGKPADYDITGLLQDCCFKLTNPICVAVQDLVGGFDPEFQEKLRNNVIVAGGGSRLRGIDRAIEMGLQEYGGGEVITVQDAEYAGAEGSLKMALEMPEEYWEQL
jgi:rod shape-determining protein MreB and related proteins